MPAERADPQPRSHSASPSTPFELRQWKLRAPSHRRLAVPRALLLRALEDSDAVPGRVSIAAGPGWGKTTLLAHWRVRGTDRPFAWVIDRRERRQRSEADCCPTSQPRSIGSRRSMVTYSRGVPFAREALRRGSPDAAGGEHLSVLGCVSSVVVGSRRCCTSWPACMLVTGDRGLSRGMCPGQQLVSLRHAGVPASPARRAEGAGLAVEAGRMSCAWATPRRRTPTRCRPRSGGGRDHRAHATRPRGSPAGLYLAALDRLKAQRGRWRRA